jgi:hypothetical protein
LKRREFIALHRCNGFAAANTRATDAGIDNPRGLSWRRGVIDEPALARRLPPGLEIGVDGRVALPKNIVFGESYRVGRVIGAGGFGIAYEAEDIHLRTFAHRNLQLYWQSLKHVPFYRAAR